MICHLDPSADGRDLFMIWIFLGSKIGKYVKSSQNTVITLILLSVLFSACQLQNKEFVPSWTKHLA